MIRRFLIILAVFFLPNIIFAQVVITEIMHNPAGGDSDREWVEIYNPTNETVDLSLNKCSSKDQWRFSEKSGSHYFCVKRGDGKLLPQSYAIISNDYSVFQSEWGSTSCQIFNSSFSLNNSSSTVAIKKDNISVDETFYSFTFTSDQEKENKSLQKVDGVWTALSPSPCLATSSSDSTTISTPTATTTESQTTEETSSSSNWPVEPQLYAKITQSPQISIVGADMVYKGVGFGLDKKVLYSARYFWNFGDGVTKEGESVSHLYKQTGEYVVSLEVSSGFFSNTARTKVKVIPADLKIISVKSGSDGFVKIKNGNSEELDISFWQISSLGKNFIIPRNTFILPKSELSLSAEAIGTEIIPEDIKLLYPNGDIAFSYDPNVKIAKSVNLSSENEQNYKKDSSDIVQKAKSVEQEAPVYNNQESANVYSAVEEKGSIIPWILGVGAISFGSAAVVIFGKRRKLEKVIEPGDDFTIID